MSTEQVMKPLRVGVVGVGYLGKFHAEKYARIEGVKLAGVVDIIPDRAESVAKRLGTEPFSDYRDLIGQVDAVSVVVPTPLHFSISRDFLQNDVNVLIEKPMTETLEEADALIEIADSCGLIIQVGHLERFNPAVVALRQIVERPLFIESHRLHIPKEAERGEKVRGTEVDVILDLMIHDIDIILNFVKSEVDSIHAAGVPVVSPNVDIANARLVFENGCVANITASRISMKDMRKTRIFQKDTYVSVDYASREIVIIQRGGKGMPLPIPGMSLQRKSFEETDSLESELAAFVQSVRNREVPLVSGREGRNALRVALSIMDQIEATNEDFLRKTGSF
ncbi:MAG: Gfo/Idh/MocA family oxidoreductase [Desulfobacteria bacterium]